MIVLKANLKYFLEDILIDLKILYPDLSIINVSDSLREMYRYKLNNMAINEIIYNIHK